MKIAVNARFLIPGQLEGIGVFTREVLLRMIKKHPESEFILFFDRKPPDWFTIFDNVKTEVLSPPARHPVLWFFWFEFSLPAALNRHRPDIFVSMDGYISLRPITPVLTVIHDLAFEHFPKDVPRLASWYYRFFFPKFARSAACIATVSEFSKQDIISRYGISRDKIYVVYNGAGEVFKPLPENEQENVRLELTGGDPYFIYIGAIHKRKNIARLLQAFDLFKEHTGLPHKLVLTGRKAWKVHEANEALRKMKHRNDVVLTGRVSQEDLSRYLASALTLCYVSYFEGFGIPLLEAMHCDVPVLAANATSFPEVAGDAALFVDPHNTEDISSAMNKMATDPALRNSLIEKGRIRRKTFNWDKTAERLWESIRKVTDENWL